MADVFSYLDVSSSYSNGALTITIRTKDGFTSAVINTALQKIGTCADTASTSNQQGSETTTTQNSQTDETTTQYVKPGPTPGPGPEPTRYGYGCAIKFRAIYGDTTAETDEIDTGCPKNSTRVDNKTFTLTIQHAPPTNDTFTLKILGLAIKCGGPASETSGQA